MVVCNRLSDIPEISQSALTIGSFDGIHCGHLEILKRIKVLSSENSSTSVVVTFDPHPKTVLRPDLLEDRYLITTLDKKIEIFEVHEIDCLLILPFDETFANIDANTFLEDIIIKHFKPHDIVVGYDHHFGHNRVGDIELLNSYSTENLYDVHEIDQIAVDSIPVSSSKIRNVLASENIYQANRLLGWNYELKGIVEIGDGLGKTIGYPTANINPTEAHQIIPSDGVYSVDLLIEGDSFHGMCNIGNRPTVDGTSNRIEVNIFSNENIDLYSKEVTVVFKEYLRNEKKFSSIDKLKVQLEIDKKRCLELNRMIKGVKTCQ
ncbi:MAG: bifunctional riboflavin kinase/FAD synthetase [Candidatus Marinimicrobia bacterium]|nr:bifunctional riboflavin kinase/FAD synthetase [Candidatus Neomarinimicrobiota bacterium]